MKVGTNLWLGYEPLYLANKIGYLKDEQVRLVEYSSASQVLMAYRNGAIDFAALTLDEALLLLENKFRPKIVFVLDISNGGDVILGQPAITRFEQLVDKRIGVEDTALGAFVLSRALEINHMELSKVTVVPLEFDKHERAFLNREVDAVATFEPVKSKLLAKNANILFDSTQIPREIVDVLVVNEEYYVSHAKEVSQLKAAWFNAMKFINQNREDAVTIMNSRQKLSLEEFTKAYNGIHFPDEQENDLLLSPQHKESLLPILNRLVTVMLSKQLLQTNVDPKSLFFTPAND